MDENNNDINEYAIDGDTVCPECDNQWIHWRDCTDLLCFNGFVDCAEEDPINFVRGEAHEKCYVCKGTGVEQWCPNCGVNLSGRIDTNAD